METDEWETLAQSKSFRNCLVSGKLVALKDDGTVFCHIADVQNVTHSNARLLELAPIFFLALWSYAFNNALEIYPNGKQEELLKWLDEDFETLLAFARHYTGERYGLDDVYNIRLNIFGTKVKEEESK